MYGERGDAMRTMAAGEFKAKCLAVMAEVNATGQPLLVTKRGKPLARVMPLGEDIAEEETESIFGFMRGMGTITGDIVSSEFTDEEWEQMADEGWKGIKSEDAR
jgi:prevent-host-death family protein